MEKYAPKFSNVLLTPDPHYIPGYAGYCPQLKFSFAQSYGKLTGELLTSPEVNHSSRLVLSMGHASSTETDADLTLRNIPDGNLKRTTPGYTGFIPKSQNFFACNYTEMCCKALTEFYQDQQARLQRESLVLPLVVSSTIQQTDRPKPPLSAISNKEITNKHMKSFTPLGNPYSMEDDNPHKYFISGFTGHVPKARFLIGKGYPITSNQALVQFGKELRYLASKDDPGKKTSSVPSMPTIYPSNRGMVPSFKGHIPGYQFMYGHTFGQLSKSALEKFRTERSLQGKS